MAQSKSTRRRLQSRWTNQLGEYITSIAIATDGSKWAASTAAGEVVYWHHQQQIELATATGATVDSLAFDASNRYLVAGGQTGNVCVWDCSDATAPQLSRSIAYKSTWIDSIAWHPQQPELAVANGRFVQIWDIDRDEIVATLDFDLSTVFDLAWHPTGKYLAVAGNLGVRVWNGEDWDAEPELMPAQNAIARIAWSPDGRFLAGTTLDRCLLVGEISALANTWIMRGFPARIERLAWIDRSPPSIAAISAEALVVWEYADQSWTALPPDFHRDPIAAMSVHPIFPLVATASIGGEIAIWEATGGAMGVLDAIESNFTQIVWHPIDRTLITGTESGAVTIWG